MHLGRMLLIAVVLTLVAASVAGNPIPVPSLLMPEEFIDADIGGSPDALRAIVDGCYPFTNLGHQSVKMLYPVAPASTNIGVWMDGSPVNWWWSTEAYPTILPEWPLLPMTEWNIQPVPDQFSITAHYEHDVVRRPGEFVFLYPMGTGKYLQTYAKQTTALVTVSLDGRYLPKGVFRDADSAPFRLAASEDDWRLSAEVTSEMFYPLLQDFILTFIDRWADPRSWFSQPPDMADGRDIYSSIEVNCLPPADDFVAPADGVAPATVRQVRWWGSYPGWHVQEAHPEVSAYPRPDYFLIRILDDGAAAGPGELRYEERIDAFTQTYYGAVVRELVAGESSFEYEHKFEYRTVLSRPFMCLPGERYWLSIVAGPVACEWAWGWATSPVPGGEPAWLAPCDTVAGPAPLPFTGVQTSGTRDAPLIYCTGTECGGDGPRRYSYEVDSASFPMMEFRAGTNDLDRSRYTSVLIPEGWQFAVEARPMGHYHGHKTPHGVVSDGPCRCLTQGSVRWWTEDPACTVEFFTFGYDHPWVSEDVSWELTTRREGPPPQYYTGREVWDAPVGTGFGPVHGPASDGRVDMAFVLASAVEPHPRRYRLIEGSMLTEDCDGCDRPAVTVPIRGSFWLYPVEVDPLVSNYAVRRLRFHSLELDPAYRGEGHGTYRLREGAVPLLQQMLLDGRVNEFQDLHFDSGLVAPQAPFPWIEIDVPQVAPADPLHIFSLHLVAVPWPAVWFSTEVGFTPSAGGQVSDGDLLNSVGRVVRSNGQLTARLGMMPVAPDIGLDAVSVAWTATWQPTPVTARPEIWFSSELDDLSETLGPLSQGDVLSDAGAIIRRNADLIAPFSPQPPIPDLGLDVVTRGPDGRLLFSTETAFFSEGLGAVVDDGDLLSEDGTIFRTTAQLMANFQPIDPIPLDAGLDAAYVWPHGEVWFSTETGFTDQRLGLIRDGDLLSDTGRVVYRNLELVGPFGPLEDLADFGLDAVHVLWPVVRADFDGDGDVDRDDLKHLAACSSGPAVPQENAGCVDADLDEDSDVDQSDFAEFQRCLSSEGQPADPRCQF